MRIVEIKIVEICIKKNKINQENRTFISTFDQLMIDFKNEK